MNTVKENIAFNSNILVT